MFIIIFLVLGILILQVETTFLQLLPAWLGKVVSTTRIRIPRTRKIMINMAAAFIPR